MSLIASSPVRSPWPRRIMVITVLIAVAAAVASWVIAGRVGTPTLVMAPTAETMRDRTSISIDAGEPMGGLTHVLVRATGPALSADKVLVEESFAPGAQPRWQRMLTLDADTLGALRQGGLRIEVAVDGAGTWRVDAVRIEATRSFAVDLTAPKVSSLSTFVFVAQGGAETVVYQVDDDALIHGVVMTSMDGQRTRVAPGFRRPDHPGQAIALFAIDYDEEGPEEALQKRVLLFAEDAVGNRSTAPFVHKFIPRPMGRDVIELSDGFLSKVVDPIAVTDPKVPRDGTPLQRYLFINGELRRDNNARLVALAKDTAPRALWTEAFQPFGDAAIKGAFADRRQYRYQGKDVDQQDHLGFDLARTAQSPVNVGNDGWVVLASMLGIYGNCVVVDHGLGLMTIYAHLSSIDVAVGADVKRGQIIGKTGATGLAGGDHLHFTTMLHGQPCNPIEWWDDHWITDRFRRKL